MRGIPPLEILTLTLVLARPTLAHPADCSAIPNGSVNTCANCHVSSSGGGTRTPFGEDVATTRSGGAVQWPALSELDSDRDDQTNGQELGDPCGTWHVGATPGRTTEISNPGVSTSLSSTPAIPVCTDAGNRDQAAASDSTPPQPDAAVPPRDAGLRDAGQRDTSSAGDRVASDRGAALDVAGAEHVACTPVCIDSLRIYSCTAAGAHVETACPSGQFCTNGVCSNSGTSSQDDAAGCTCHSTPAGTSAMLALVVPLWRRRQRRVD